MDLLDPAGLISRGEAQLMLHAVELMLIVIIPVLILTFLFAWYYRAGNHKAKYLPNWEHGKMDELIWWAIPFEIVLVLGALTWSSTHQLDPHKAITSDIPPLVIEVVALQWKWLFIYPEEDIATVNTIDVPINRPVEFHITADAPMNSFWIPRLGGQIYAMTGMVTTLNLIGDKLGTFEGRSANYSGDGFAQMKFATNVVSEQQFNAWVSEVKKGRALSRAVYDDLSKPSFGRVAYFGDVAGPLFDNVISKFMGGMHH